MKSFYSLILISLCHFGYAQISPPVITSFDPVSGPTGTTVTISGSNFNPGGANNIVYFGAVKAMVTASSPTTITVTVPEGATYKPLSVLNPATGLSGYSTVGFITTFNNPFTNGLPINFYQPKINFATGTNPNNIVIKDIDGDGKPDVIITNSAANTVSVLRNNTLKGNATLSSSSFETKVDFPVSGAPHLRSVAAGDLDGDGKPDLVVCNFNQSSISILHNISDAGSITPFSFASKVDFPTDVAPISVAIGDIDGDGRPEIITGNTYTASMFHNTSEPGSITPFSFAPKVDLDNVFANDSENSFVALNDMDGDGKTDLIVNSALGLYLFQNIASPGNVSISSFAAPVIFSGGNSLAIGDLDGDNKPDIVLGSDILFSGSSHFGKVTVYHNQSIPGSIANTSFEPGVKFQTAYSVGDVTIADIDGDSKPEIIASSRSYTISVLRNRSINGSITPSSFSLNVDFQGGGGLAVAAGDIDADGIPELIGIGNPFIGNINTVAAFKISDVSNKITFYGKIYLQGAYNTTDGLMHNSLNSLGVLQTSATSHPYSDDPFRYTGSEKVGDAFFDAHTNLVDWVLVELRNASAPSSILATRAAFVKQDGTLTDIDGTTDFLTFQGFTPGNYYIAIRHRNHLSIRSSAPIDFITSAGNYDFTTAAAKSFQSQSYTSTVSLGNIWAMRGGNANSDNSVKFNGPNNDQNQVLNLKLGGSLSVLLNNQYATEDVNMDGTVKANGPGNDPNFLLNAVLGGLLSAIYNEQL